MEVVIEVPRLLCRSFQTYGACCSEQDQEHQGARGGAGGHGRHCGSVAGVV